MGSLGQGGLDFGVLWGVDVVHLGGGEWAGFGRVCTGCLEPLGLLTLGSHPTAPHLPVPVPPHHPPISTMPGAEISPWRCTNITGLGAVPHGRPRSPWQRQRQPPAAHPPARPAPQGGHPPARAPRRPPTRSPLVPLVTWTHGGGVGGVGGKDPGVLAPRLGPWGYWWPPGWPLVCVCVSQKCPPSKPLALEGLQGALGGGRFLPPHQAPPGCFA